MPKKYALEIFQPDAEGYVTACLVESDDPFLAVQRGDFINPLTWNMYCADSLEAEYRESAYGIVLKVVGVEHRLIQRENGSISQHKIAVFTKVVENNQTVLFGDA